jgi:hypothetical protein
MFSREDLVLVVPKIGTDIVTEEIGGIHVMLWGDGTVSFALDMAVHMGVRTVMVFVGVEPVCFITPVTLGWFMRFPRVRDGIGLSLVVVWHTWLPWAVWQEWCKV